MQRHDRHRADDVAVLDGDRARRARARPLRDDLRIVDVLLEERAVGFGDAREEARQHGLVAGLDRAEFHHRSSGSERSYECSMIQDAMRGMVCLTALRPVPNVT